MFSVRAATANGTTVIFKKGSNALIHRDGTKFHITTHNRLYYLHTENDECEDKFKSCYDRNGTRSLVIVILTMFRNYRVLLTAWALRESQTKLQHIVKCALRESPFRQGIETKSALELLHTDIVGPIDPESRDGHRFALSFTDDFSSVAFVYFLKQKSDTVQATEKFLADTL